MLYENGRSANFQVGMRFLPRLVMKGSLKGSELLPWETLPSSGIKGACHQLLNGIATWDTHSPLIELNI